MNHKRFFAELKRRKVFKVAAMYGATGFVVLQVADLMVEPLGLPDWAMPLILTLTFLGFPIAIVLAWAFEATPEGVRRQTAPQSGEITQIIAQPASRRWVSGLLALLGVVLLIGSGWMIGRRSAGGTEAPISTEAEPAPSSAAEDGALSIAVLPFVNMSGDADNEYFSDGLSEELINALAAIDGLKVTARTSAFSFKGRDEDVREIGEALGVGHVLEGSVRRAGDDVRITAQLIQTNDGFHLWSETYDRELTDIFAIQEEIADAIAEKLELTLTAEGKSRLAHRRTDDLEAYDLYLLGRHNYGTRTDTGLVKAREYFEAAIAIDSSFAPAWAGLAGVYNALPWYVRGFDPRETSQTSYAAGQKALELDPNLAEAHAVVGVTFHEYLWNWERAEEHYLRATELDPDYAQGWNWYCQLLTLLGRVAEGIDTCQRAVDAEPLVMRYVWLLGFTYATADSIERAMVLYEEAVTSDQALPEMWGEYATVLLGAEQYEKAAWALEGWARVDGLEGPERMAAVAAAITDPSLRPEAIAIVDDFAAQGLADPYPYVAVWTALGETERALDLLEELFEARNPNVIFLRVVPWVDPLRGDPRFERLVERLNLPPELSTGSS